MYSSFLIKFEYFYPSNTFRQSRITTSRLFGSQLELWIQALEGIPAILLKKCCKSLSLPLTILCRKSLKIGKISPRLKASYIHPQLKQGGKQSNPASWRPIALTSQISKVFEKYLKEVIMNHLEQNNLLGDHQFGFRSKRSCLAQMLSYYEKFSKKLKMAKM